MTYKPIALDYPYNSGTTGCIAATYNRALEVDSQTATAATSGTLRLFKIYLVRGMPITNISFWSGSTALSVGSNQWFGLFDSGLNVVAKTADDTSTAWAATTKKTLAITGGPYVVPSTGIYYVGILIKATTVPTIIGRSSQSTTPRGDAPAPGGNSTTGLTTPASCTGAQTAITALSAMSYAELT